MGRSDQWWTQNNRDMKNRIRNNRRHDPRIVYRYKWRLRSRSCHGLRRNWRNDERALLRLCRNLGLGHSWWRVSEV